MPSESGTVDAALLLDRFVSASSSEDIHNSLQQILHAVQTGDLTSQEVCAELDILSALLSVFQESKYKGLTVEDGSALTARIYSTLIEKGERNTTVTLLQEPDPGRLLESAIDVASDSSVQPYPRVLALQLLRRLAITNPKLAQQQLLAAPNGLHRLGDLLNFQVAEQVRNEAVILAACIAEWAAVAKVWMFSEVGDVVIQTALQEGGLTGGNMTVLDCLKLLQTMLKHDSALADLVFQSPVLAPNLARLLDLRGGQAFLRPSAVPTVVDDDLDDLLAAEADQKQKKKPLAPVPKLSEPEEMIISAVLDILSTVLENENVKRSVWKQHGAMASLVWEMALLTPPPDPTMTYPCAVPSISLQQRTLQVVAAYFDSVSIMERHAGVDRLLFLVCTGGRGQTLAEKMELSQSALHVIRRTLTDAAANEMLMHTLAPPMELEDSTGPPQPVQPTVIQKLLNTAFENLKTPTSSKNTVSRKICLAGSLGALSLFLTDEPRRSILLRLTSSNETTLLDAVLQCLVTETDETANDFIPLQLLRFLGQWVMEAPMVVQALLSSSHAVSLSVIFISKQENVSAMAGLLLGLCMEFMSDESQCGGWTRSNLLELIQQNNVARFTTKLEMLKTVTELPWSSCRLEWQIWLRWYEDAVLVVRKRVVQELTAGGIVEDDGDEDSGSESFNRKGMKTMQRLVAEQADEIEELRAALSESQRIACSRGMLLTIGLMYM